MGSGEAAGGGVDVGGGGTLVEGGGIACEAGNGGRGVICGEGAAALDGEVGVGAGALVVWPVSRGGVHERRRKTEPAGVLAAGCFFPLLPGKIDDSARLVASSCTSVSTVPLTARPRLLKSSVAAPILSFIVATS